MDVSRKAATSAIGAWVIAQIMIQYPPTAIMPANSIGRAFLAIALNTFGPRLNQVYDNSGNISKVVIHTI